ncbi:hypothetical protein ATANTOWER_020392 [Ataeniobius toweri]|uniref:Uncharacterized protein n=1 Tax=Ataeniobius toweri TaxID=208326 RepID=A0ABU7C8L3_9TELE|nr:hypothetical protein [Ataeniobius toweri]
MLPLVGIMHKPTLWRTVYSSEKMLQDCGHLVAHFQKPTPSSSLGFHEAKRGSARDLTGIRDPRCADGPWASPQAGGPRRPLLSCRDKAPAARQTSGSWINAAEEESFQTSLKEQQPHPEIGDLVCFRCCCSE